KASASVASSAQTEQPIAPECAKCRRGDRGHLHQRPPPPVRAMRSSRLELEKRGTLVRDVEELGVETWSISLSARHQPFPEMAKRKAGAHALSERVSLLFRRHRTSPQVRLGSAMAALLIDMPFQHNAPAFRRILLRSAFRRFIAVVNANLS